MQKIYSSVYSVLIFPGLRQFHESGPELKRTISGHLNEILDAEEPTTRRDSVKYHPGPEEMLEYDSSQPRPSLSQRQLMLEQEARTNINMPVM